MVAPPRCNRMGPRSTNVGYSVKGFVKLGLVILLFAFMGLIVYETAVVQKKPVTNEQVCNIMIGYGYEPQDITNKYYQRDPDFKETLIKCIAVEKNDIRFDFFEFNNQNSAESVFSQAYNDFITQYDDIKKTESDNQSKNVRIYTLDSPKKYCVAIYVSNTAVYAYCNSENKNEINKILDAIDYLEP